MKLFTFFTIFLTFLFVASCASSESDDETNGAVTDADTVITDGVQTNPDQSGTDSSDQTGGSTADPDQAANETPDQVDDEVNQQPDEVQTTPDTEEKKDEELVLPDNSNGGGDVVIPPEGTTWTDPDTGLTWDATDYYNPDGLNKNDLKFSNAEKFCEESEVGGLTEWRLPTIDELRALVVGCDKVATGGECSVTDKTPIVGYKNEFCYGICQAEKSDNPECPEGVELCTWGNGPGAEGCYWKEGMPSGCGSIWSSTEAGSSWRRMLNFWTASITSGHNSFPDGSGYYARCVHD